MVSNSRESTGKEETVEKDELSVIYRWNKKTQRFVHYQALQTHCARDWEAFRIQGHTYLAVANHRQGRNWLRPTTDKVGTGYGQPQTR